MPRDIFTEADMVLSELLYRCASADVTDHLTISFVVQYVSDAYLQLNQWKTNGHYWEYYFRQSLVLAATHLRDMGDLDLLVMLLANKVPFETVRNTVTAATR